MFFLGKNHVMFIERNIINVMFILHYILVINIDCEKCTKYHLGLDGMGMGPCKHMRDKKDGSSQQNLFKLSSHSPCSVHFFF